MTIKSTMKSISVILVYLIYMINGQTPSPTMSPTPPTMSPTTFPTLSPTMSPTDSPTVSPTPPTMSPTDRPTVSPTPSPTDSPTVSPTTSPTMSPTTSPTLSPTRSPTVPLDPITDILKLSIDTQCGATSLSVSTEPNIYECIKKCDNHELCDKSSFKNANGECKLFVYDGNTNSEASGVVCTEQLFHSPDRNYHDAGVGIYTENTQCSEAGTNVFGGYDLTEVEGSNLTFVECVSFCNAFVECTGFEFTNGDTCTLYNGPNITFANYTGSGTKSCYIKDSDLFGSFVVHSDYECGNDLLSTEVGTDGYNETKCYDHCSVNPLCGGYEFIASVDSCYLYGEVSLTNVTGKDCYKRSDGVNSVIGQHTVRLIFTEATWNVTLHATTNFTDYLTTMFDAVLNKQISDITVEDGSSGGIVVDFLVDDIHALPLGREDVYHLLNYIATNGDTYLLGTQLLGDYNLAPPTPSPTSSPTDSPTLSPTTGTPTVAPTRAPTVAASEIIHFFEIVEDHRCGLPANNYTIKHAGNVWQCMSECDNDNVCVQATFDVANSSCVLFAQSQVLHASEQGKHCLIQKYAGPHHSYSSLSDKECNGVEILSDTFSNQTLVNADWSDCSYVCNNWLECEGFNFVESSGTCTFFKDHDDTLNIAAGTECNIKDFQMTGTYAGHENMACGVNVRGQANNVEYGFHSCIADCDNDPYCMGWEYYESSNTCVRYATVNLYSSPGKTCYSRAFQSDVFLDKHLGRIRFVDAVWNATIHETSEFRNYIEGVIEHVVQKNITVLFIVEGSVIIEYTVTAEYESALSGQQLALIKDKILADGMYDLGVNLIGGSDPPPPTPYPTLAPTTAHPTMSPTDSPTSAPTSRPTSVPTGAPTVSQPPTTAISAIFEGHHTVEIIVFVLIGISSAIFLYVIVKFALIWSRRGSDVVNYDSFL